MHYFIRLPFMTMTVLLSSSLIIAAHTVAAEPLAPPSRAPAGQLMAQSGSMGGTLGNRDKSLSGSREVEPERPARRSQPKESRRPAAARSNRGGGGNFDGSWSISSAGITCSDTFRETVVVTGSKLVGSYGGGSVSASGVVTGSGNYSGVGVTSRGRFSGRSGSGTFQRSDGCRGRWTASKK